jgi:hypothetical protein
MFTNDVLKKNGMESHSEMLESLAEKAVAYGKTSFMLAKLKALGKTSDVASSLFSHAIVIYLGMSFTLFTGIGLAIWLGELLGKSFYGFFIIAFFYGLAGIFIHLFLHKWIKKVSNDHFIEQLLK